MTTHYSKQFKLNVFPFLKGYVMEDGTQRVYIKVKFKPRDKRIKPLPEVNIPVYDEMMEKINLSKSEFKSNRYSIKAKNRIAEVTERVEFAIHHFLSNNMKFDIKKLKDFIYNNMEQSNNVKSEEYVTDKDVLIGFGLDEPQPKSLMNKLMTIKTEDFETETGELNDLETVVEAKRSEWFREKEKAEIDNMDWQERYKRGFYNKENIFDLFGLLLSTDKNGEPYIPNSYRGLIVKLADYRFNETPNEHISQFNKEWVDDFINFLKHEGYVKTVQPRSYDPLKMEKYAAKFRTGDREFYTHTSFKKQIKHLRSYIDKLQELGYIRLDAVNLKHIKASNYIKNTDTINYPRANHHLTTSELEILLHNPIKDNERLELVRQMFLLQTFAGGLRNEGFFNNLLKLKKSENQYYFAIYSSKNDVTIENPLIEGYSDLLLEQMNYQIPEFLSLNEYRKALKELAKHFNLNREIRYKVTKVNEKRSVVYDKPIYELILPYFARKSFIQFGTANGWSHEFIMTYTGHKKSDTLNHYKTGLSFTEKRRLLDRYKNI